MVSKSLDNTSFKHGHKLVDGIAAKPGWVILAAGILTLVLGFGVTMLGVNFSLTAFVSEDDPLLIEFNRYEREFGNDDTIVVALNSESGIFNEESLKLLSKLTRQLEAVPDVDRVTSLSNHTQIRSLNDELHVGPLLPERVEWTSEFLQSRRAVALADEVIPNYLLSLNAQTTLVFAQLRPALDDPIDLGAAVSATRSVVQGLEREGHRFFVAGGPAITAGFEEEATKDLTVLLPMMFLLVVICLAWTLKSIVSVFLALTVVGLSIVATFGLAGWLGIPITNSSSFLPQILIAIGIADGVHLLSVFFRTMAQGQDKNEAARHSLLKNFQPTILTTLSTGIGFLSFTNSPIQSIADFGFLAGSGVLFAWIYSYGALGPLLFLLPIKVRASTERSRDQSVQRTQAFVGVLIRYRRSVLLLFCGLVVVSCWLALQNRVNADPYEYFSDEVPVRIANDFILDEIGGIRGVDLILRRAPGESVLDPSFMKKVDALQKWLEEIPEVTRTVSLVNIIKSMNRSLNNDNPNYYVVPETIEAVSQFLLLYSMSSSDSSDLKHLVTEENDALHITILWTLSDSVEWIAAEEKILEHARANGLTPNITGKGTIFQHLGPYLIETFVESMSIALILMSVLLVFIFRSLRMGLLALMTNCIPLVGGAAVFYLAGRSVDFGSVLVASVCLGIAVDDTIHILSNYERLRGQGLSPCDAMVQVLEHTAPALIITTIILVAGFGTLAFGNFVPNIYFGLMTAVILVFALVTDVVFLPAVLVSEESGEP